MNRYKTNWYKILLDNARDDYRLRLLERTLEPLETTIKATAEHELKNYPDENSEDSKWEAYDDYLYEEGVYVEELVGASFVLCQAYIEFVVTKVKRLDIALKKIGIGLPVSDKIQLLKNNTEMALNGFTKIEVIDAAANYYKHKSSIVGDSWKDGSSLNPNAKVLKGVGGSYHSSANFRTALSSIGIKEYGELSKVVEILEDWSWETFDKISDELKNRGLI